MIRIKVILDKKEGEGRASWIEVPDVAIQELSVEGIPCSVEPDDVGGVERGGARKAQSPSRGKARKSQRDLLSTLAVELRGEHGVERLEEKIGKPLTELTSAEADEWIDRLTPEDRE